MKSRWYYRKRKPLPKICSGEDCFICGHKFQGNAKVRGVEVGVLERVLCDELGTGWAPGPLGHLHQTEAAAFPLKVKPEDECLDMSSKRCLFTTST